MNSKIVIVLFLLAGALYSFMANQNTPIIENWWGTPGFKARVDPSLCNSKCGKTSIKGAGNLGGAFFTVPGTYQTAVAPRFQSQGMGASITYNLPQVQNLAADPNNPTSAPMNLANLVETFDMKSSQEAKSQIATTPSTDDLSVQMSLPAEDMSAMTGAAPFVCDRFIYANRKSNLRASADPIRGDLAIAPCTTGWFRPSVTPSTDLNSGAMAVMGGAYNDTTRLTSGLKMMSNGGSDTTHSGVNFEQPSYTAMGRVNMASQKNVMGSMGPNHSGDVTVSSFA
jgi:hypothetical protein